METSNIIAKESLIFVATVFIGYGTTVIQTNFPEGAISLFLGAIVLGIRAYLKSKLIEIDRSN